MWGTEYIDVNYSGIVFLTEAVFRSVALHRLGIASMSLLGSSCSKKLLREIRNHPKYDFVWIGDPKCGSSDAGKIMVNKIGGFQSPKDLDEMTDHDLREMFIKEGYDYVL